MNERKILMLPVEEVFPDLSQPRQSLPREALEQMIASIKSRGILQPIRVRWDEARGLYQIVSGETRWRGAKDAGLKVVPCIEADGELTEADLLTDQLVENVVRNDIPPVQLAKALSRLKALKGCNSQTLAAEIGMSPASVCRFEALLSLPPAVQSMVDQGSVPESTAYEISRLPDTHAQLELAQAVAGGMNREQAAQAVRERVGKRESKPKASRLPLRLEGGICVTVSAAQALDWDSFNTALDRVRKEAKRLYDNGRDLTELARLLRA